MIQKHIPLIEEAGEKGAQILCLQEIFYGPYFCAEQDMKWYETAEKADYPKIRLFSVPVSYSLEPQEPANVFTPPSQSMK